MPVLIWINRNKELAKKQGCLKTIDKNRVEAALFYYF
jgi:hypothetical protein